MKIFTLFVGFTFLFLATAAQQWKDYLNDGTVTCFATDNDTIWVGMEGGVAKYLIDGTKLANYTRADGLARVPNVPQIFFITEVPFSALCIGYLCNEAMAK
jgi:hypothetical protein